jgi:uncharacterized protein (TIGR02466 family)
MRPILKARLAIPSWYFYCLLQKHNISSSGAGLGAVDVSAVPTVEMLHLMSTPVVICRWPDTRMLNAQLRRLILQERESSRGGARTIERGWQSVHDAPLQWNDPAVATVVDRIKTMVRELVERTTPRATAGHLDGWDMTIWCNVNPPGGGHYSHAHTSRKSIWSGVYYVDVGEPDGDRPKGGRFILEDRSGMPKEVLSNADPYEREIAIEPEEGMMLLFSAWQYHRVEPFSGRGYRISIAFNMRHSGFVIPQYPGMAPSRPGWRRALANLPGMFYARKHFGRWFRWRPPN